MLPLPWAVKEIVAPSVIEVPFCEEMLLICFYTIFFVLINKCTRVGLVMMLFFSESYLTSTDGA
jgi:hypothetical protein